MKVKANIKAGDGGGSSSSFLIGVGNNTVGQNNGTGVGAGQLNIFFLS